ncbi:MAG: TnpV protein [Clostridiales bacterium]|nr:TnpV protein [Clostridiales bacterium]
MAQTQGVNDQMKQESPMKWVQMMNSFKTSAEETVIAELICA